MLRPYPEDLACPHITHGRTLVRLVTNYAPFKQEITHETESDYRGKLNWQPQARFVANRALFDRGGLR